MLRQSMRWTDLNSPTGTGRISVHGLGFVHVVEDDLKVALANEGHVEFVLIPSSAGASTFQEFRLGTAIPFIGDAQYKHEGLISYEELNSPEEPCEIIVAGLGIVGVTQRDIDNARDAGGEIAWSLIKSSYDRERRFQGYRLGKAVPL